MPQWDALTTSDRDSLASDCDSDESVETEEKAKLRVGRRVACSIWALGIVVVIMASLLVVLPGRGEGHATNVPFQPLVAGDESKPKPTAHPPARWEVSTLAGLLGIDRQNKLQSTILVVVAFCCVWGSTVTSTAVAVNHPTLVPKDFEHKGTLSNVSQDVVEPHGRLFTVALFTSGLLNIGAMYTFWLYRAWAPWYDETKNPLGFPTFQCRNERRLRTLWVVVPSVGFMFTAAIPSLSDTSGYKWTLMLVHNVLAPSSMAMCMIMETVQLGFGESAFSYFFSNEPTPVYGPLTAFQRLRVLVLIGAWGCCAIFMAIQVYLGLGRLMRIRIRRSHGLSLASMMFEVGCLVLVALLPCIAGFGTQYEGKLRAGVMEQAYSLIETD